MFNLLNSIMLSPKFQELNREFGRDGEFRLLEVGCGNHSATIAKRIFRNCKYYGLDKGVYNNDKNDFQLMEEFYNIDLASGDLAILPDESFDAIIISHVIEHLKNGLEVIGRLCRKLKTKGSIYIEFPSERSLSVPHTQGMFYFCGDETHIKLYDIKEAVNVLLENNFKIIKAGPRRNKFRIILAPFRYIYLRYIRKAPYAASFLDFFGLADFILARKR